MCLSEGKEEKRKRRRAQQKNNHTRETTTQEQNPNQPDKGHKPDQTKQKRGEAGKAKEDRGGEGRAYRIRVAIVQLSGDQWGTRIIIMMNTSVW